MSVQHILYMATVSWKELKLIKLSEYLGGRSIAVEGPEGENSISFLLICFHIQFCHCAHCHSVRDQACYFFFNALWILEEGSACCSAKYSKIISYT